MRNERGGHDHLRKKILILRKGRAVTVDSSSYSIILKSL
ncbi:hypothetical protein CTL2C_114 [Chlamydia trachomatis L2c]|nr:hypothetical protein CTL2C_114 [Chlamydia trachomatis L2c]